VIETVFSTSWTASASPTKIGRIRTFQGGHKDKDLQSVLNGYFAP